VIVPLIPGVADQLSSGLGSNGAIGAGLGGLGILGILLLLLFLKKRKQEKVDEYVEDTITEASVDTLQDNEEFISEYGLSDNIGGSDSDEEGNDLPVSVEEYGMQESDFGAGSEHNPEDVSIDETVFETSAE
jgi:hypothetical protein